MTGELYVIPGQHDSAGESAHDAAQGNLGPGLRRDDGNYFPVFVTFQNTVTGAMTKPSMFLRTAAG